MKKTRLIKELTRIGGKLQTHDKEPVECLFIIKNKATNRFKYVGFGDVCDNFENGLQLTKHISKCRKYTFPEQGYFPNTDEVDKEIEQLTPNKYSFGFIATQNLPTTSSSSNMTLCDLQKKRINAMEIKDSETVNIKRKRELFSQKARGRGARGGGRQQFKEISSDSESESDGAINKRLKKANRGRGRGKGALNGKGRGKTSQSRTTEANVLEQHVEEELSDEIPMIIHDSKSPEKKPKHAFYLKPLSKPTGQVWFAAMPVGINMLTATIARLCKEAGLKGFRSNHSLRATAATRLYEDGQDEQLISEITGHKSNAVREYKRTNTEMKRKANQTINSKPSEQKKPRSELQINSAPSTFQVDGNNINITLQVNFGNSK
ncbi:unnamed protein product [Mytilus edulis]|uniref:Tyr recombinase domain-containing protein n=1 Tax=Mytilus edulis TaxID=6550 RepID=A0A8S3RU58_MYTED|nr:unnamed protein product [Mytilus edulis]